ncbi:ATP-binding protein [Kineosporia sp. R_H_3]|uniref:ATP-binding protein n=1 Tax=Kineosporia sp. R_H_3 TaxID=1961848 RepID=UPI001179EEB1|nr:ATP-binding protein [Kineosporia sp. R_H_3]
MTAREYSVFDVFTPSTQATINFVERPSVTDQLVDALRTPGKQVVVYGETGSGKSTLLQHKLDELYPAYVTSRCTAQTTHDSLILDAFDQLNRYYIDFRTREASSTLKGNLGADFLAIKASVESQIGEKTTSSARRFIPPQLTVQRLGQFIGAEGMCWVLEDFHKVPVEEKTALAQTLKVFSDLAKEFPTVRIVALGATDTARQVVQFDREMANRVAEIHVPLMTSRELMTIVANGVTLMNVDALNVVEDIVSFSSGLASVCHHLMLNACISAGVERTAAERLSIGENDLGIAIKRYMDESSDTLKSLFELALARQRVRKYDNTRLIVQALAAADVDGLTAAGIHAHIRKAHAEYPMANLMRYLQQLTSDERGRVVRQAIDGRYRFSQPMFRSYARLLLGISDATPLSRLLTTLVVGLANAWVSDKAVTVSTGSADTYYENLTSPAAAAALKFDLDLDWSPTLRGMTGHDG